MNRRDFIVRSSLLASAGLLVRSSLKAEASSTTSQPVPPAGPAAGPLATEFRPLRRGVGIFTGRGGTIGWLSAQDALVVVDTQFPDTAALCLAGLPERGARIIDVVLNTHHHADHTGGNGIFKPASRTIVAQANVPKLMLAAAERAAQADKPGAAGPTVLDLSQQTYPDTTFTDVWRRDFGSEIVTAQYYGPAHTSGDVIIHFERANVVHLGDLLFNRLYPVIDRPAGASIHGWIARLEEAVKTYPADAIYVCGHGNKKFGVTVAQDDLLVMRDYFTAVLEYVQQQIAAGRTKAEIATLENLPGFPDFHAPRPNRLAVSLGVAYDELTS
jgi:cyclase